MIQAETLRVYDRGENVESYAQDSEFMRIRRVAVKMAAAIDSGTETAATLAEKAQTISRIGQEAASFVTRIARGEYEK